MVGDASTEMLNHKIGAHLGSKNLILVTHAPNITSVSPEPVAMGALAVFKPTGGYTFEEMGIIGIGS